MSTSEIGTNCYISCFSETTEKALNIAKIDSERLCFGQGLYLWVYSVCSFIIVLDIMTHFK